MPSIVGRVFGADVIARCDSSNSGTATSNVRVASPPAAVAEPTRHSPGDVRPGLCPTRPSQSPGGSPAGPGAFCATSSRRVTGPWLQSV